MCSFGHAEIGCCDFAFSLPAWLVPEQKNNGHAEHGCCGEDFSLAMNPVSSTSSEVLSAKIKPEIAALAAEMSTMRRFLHSWPELGFEEVKTSTFIEDQLTKIPGVSVVTKLGVTGLIGIYRGTNPGPTVAFRADMDGLPVNERGKDESWISKNTGIAHACGHDGHVTMLLTFARAFCAKYKPSQIHGTIVFVFQPAEESGGGAPKMLADGLLTAGGLSDIDFFYGIHVISSLPVGTVATKPGPLMAGIDGFEINVKGVGGHGAMPHQTIDAIIVATNLVTQLQSIVSRNIDPTETAVLTVGKISGGTALNVIADDAQIMGTIRYNAEDVREKLHSRIRSLAKGLALAYECQIDVKMMPSYPPTINHPVETENVFAAVSKVVGPGMAIRMEKGLNASEDFSYFLRERPGAFFFIGAAPDPSRLNAFPHHSPLFDFNEEAMAIGASCWMQLAEDLLVSPTLHLEAGTARL